MRARRVDDSSSIEQIENDRWGPAPPGATRLVRTIHELRGKSLRALTPEDLRMLLGQHEGVALLVPIALTALEHDPLLEGDLHPGDVVVSVLHAPVSYWRAHPDQLARLERVLAVVEHVPAVDAPSDAVVAARIESFRARLRVG
ncbi:hypothetical protein GCM10022243_42380 [Saccharothrix violaceirubra]|uniref:Uncharacterized protein n=1 Tax=Saccharothrix violaceirubra TaxID=413306 RepID=A0A7W7T2X1_9PSEU|nr:contact-dependent growth inhibition system immunity protein [Saccharothrix violaceirubra]MBB4965526.1 hypothetical protein [Saccharothrix violaceirubra]